MTPDAPLVIEITKVGEAAIAVPNALWDAMIAGTFRPVWLAMVAYVGMHWVMTNKLPTVMLAKVLLTTLHILLAMAVFADYVGT